MSIARSPAPLLLLVALGCLPKPEAPTEAEPKPAPSAGSALFTDDFERADLGPRYRKTTGTWTVKDGALHSSGEKNVPLWLDVELPTNVKVEFTAWSDSPQVDTKIEIFGDGARHESGYIVILGGWNNTITTIARLDEHEKTRVEKRLSWERGRRYRWTVQRRDGRTLELLIDGELVLSYVDPQPLTGAKHSRLGFTNWQSQVFYDDLVITTLPQ